MTKLLVVLTFIMSAISTGIAQSQTPSYIALKYMVKVNDGSIGIYSNSIFPRYSWLDDHRLVIPIKKVVEERPGKYLLDTKYLLDIDLFILDIITGKALKLASYDNISYLGIRQSKQGDIFFISRSEYRQINQDSPGDLQRFHEYDAVNVSTLEIFPTIRETYLQQRLPSHRDRIEPSQDILRADNSSNLSNEWEPPPFYSGEDYIIAYWGESYIVAMGPFHVHSPEQYNIRLYDRNGSTAYVLPHISVYGAHAEEHPEILQSSRGGSFLFLNELKATHTVQDALQLSVRDSIISIYGFTDDDPTEYYDTVIYSMDTEDFGEDYAVGEIFEVDRETIDGSVMSTGPVNISP